MENFESEKMVEEVKKRLITNKKAGEITRIYPEEPEEIAKERIEQILEVSQPLYTIGIKDKPENNLVDGKNTMIKKQIAIEILLNLIIGRSSSLYQELYQKGILYEQPSLEYEFSKNYAHVLITGQSSNPEDIYQKFKKEVSKLKEQGIEEKDFLRMRKDIWWLY